MFTAAGEALKNITEKYVIENYEDIVKEYLKTRGHSVKEESVYNVVLEGEEINVEKKEL